MADLSIRQGGGRLSKLLALYRRSVQSIGARAQPWFVRGLPYSGNGRGISRWFISS